jgi:hypothetical protein
MYVKPQTRVDVGYIGCGCGGLAWERAYEMINTCAWTHTVGHVVAQDGIIVFTGVVFHGLLDRQ